MSLGGRGCDWVGWRGCVVMEGVVQKRRDGCERGRR